MSIKQRIKKWCTIDHIVDLSVDLFLIIWDVITSPVLIVMRILRHLIGEWFIDKIKAVVESFSKSGQKQQTELMHIRTDSSLDHETVKVQPPISLDRPSKFLFYPCNVLGCATGSPLAWNVGIDAKLVIKQVLEKL